MCQLDLFGATSGCQQVIYKERDNEKEKSPHTPLKGKETEKETSAVVVVSSPSKTTPSGARTCTRARGETTTTTDHNSVQKAQAAPARDEKTMKTAYLMQETGKAAIIHPTGSGKSFIGFKLCEAHPDSRVCWLSPSSYIFDTQIENLRRVTDGYAPENITFLTYAKLMLQTDAQLTALQPDYIILDEFHRCGAEM